MKKTIEDINQDRRTVIKSLYPKTVQFGNDSNKPNYFTIA